MLRCIRISVRWKGGLKTNHLVVSLINIKYYAENMGNNSCIELCIASSGF